MTRSAKVKLEADVAGFVPVVKGAANVTETLDDKVDALDRSLGKAAAEFKVVYYEAGKFGTAALGAAQATDKLDDEVEDLNADLKKTSADAATAAAAVKLIGGDLAGVGQGFKTVQDRSVALDLVNAKIRTSQAEVRKLATEFTKTKDVDVFARLRAAKDHIQDLVGLREQLKLLIAEAEKLAGAEGAPGQQGAAGAPGSPARRAGRGADATFGGLFQALPLNPYVAALIAGGVAAALPAAGGALLAGGAIGGAGLGIAGAAMGSPERVGAAWKTEIASIKAAWLDASKASVEPTIEGIHTIGAAFADIDLAGILGKAATFIKPLADGAAGFSRNMGAAFEALVDKAGPVVDVIAEELPEMGRAFETAFEMIGSESEGGAEALRDLLKLVESLIVAFGLLTGVLERVYSDFTKFRESLGWLPLVGKFIAQTNEPAKALGSTVQELGVHLSDTEQKSYDTGKGMNRLGLEVTGAGKAAEQSGKGFSRNRDELDVTGVTAERVALDYRNLTRDMYNTADAANSLNAEFKDLFGEMMSVDEANLAVKEGFLQLKESLTGGKDALNDNTEAGQKNIRSILDQIETLERKREADIAAGDGTLEATQKANAAYLAQIQQLRALALAAGLPVGPLDAILDKYRDLANAENIDKTITIHYKTVGTPTGVTELGRGLSRDKFAEGGYRHAATGMFIPPSNPGTLVAEPQTGGEWMIPAQGITQMRAMGLLQGAAAGYGLTVGPAGGGSMKVELAIAGGNDDFLYGAVRHGVRTGRITLKVNGNRVTV